MAEERATLDQLTRVDHLPEDLALDEAASLWSVTPKPAGWQALGAVQAGRVYVVDAELFARPDVDEADAAGERIGRVRHVQYPRARSTTPSTAAPRPWATRRCATCSTEAPISVAAETCGVRTIRG